MAAYVDSIVDYTGRTKLPHKHWCHLVATSEEELHAFAKRLELKPEWTHISRGRGIVHYDLTPKKRQLAIELGAIELSHTDFRRMLAAGDFGGQKK